MAHPHETNIKDKRIARWRMIGLDEAPDDLTEFWEAVESLPDVIAGKKYKKIIEKLFKKNGTPTFDSYEKLTNKLEKRGAKRNQEAFQEWHDTMGVIRRQVSHQMHMNRLRKARDERKQRIKEDKERRKAEREARRGRAERIALEAIEAVNEIERANAEIRRPEPRPDRGTPPESPGTTVI